MTGPTRDDHRAQTVTLEQGRGAPANGPSLSAGERYDQAYTTLATFPTFRRVLREVFGDEYPEDVDPCSHVTRTDLRRFAHELRVGPGQTFAHLGCGRGGPGLWVARETGAKLIGIDVSSVAVAQATGRAAGFGVVERARFQVGDFLATGLPSAFADAAMSVDVLWAVPDKTAALAEVARILRPGARFVFTTWDFGRCSPDDPQPADHRPLLRAAGFAVEAYEATANFERYYRGWTAGFAAAHEALVAELGEQEASDWLAHDARRLALLPEWRRILVVATRT